MVRCGVVWCGVVRCGVVWCGAVWCGVVWCGAVWCGAVWCGVVWCGVVWWLYCYVYLYCVHFVARGYTPPTKDISNTSALDHNSHVEVRQS